MLTAGISPVNMGYINEIPPDSTSNIHEYPQIYVPVI
jgi:hypothetical protein